MELRTTEETVSELCRDYESIRQSSIIWTMTMTEKKDNITDDNDNNNDNATTTSKQDPQIVFPKVDFSFFTTFKETNDDDDDDNCNKNSITDLQTLYNTIQSMQQRLMELTVKMERFRKRLQEKDPVTGNPRYGEKTHVRVQALVDAYTFLERHILVTTTKSSTFSSNDTSSSSSSSSPMSIQWIQRIQSMYLQQQREQHQQQEQLAKLHAQQEQEQRQQEELATKQRIQQEQEQRQQELLRRQQQEELLHQQAQEARVRRQQEQQDEFNWYNSIVKGPEGVQQQLQILKSSIQDPMDYAIALNALQTIFQQINAHPEEVKFRRIRRNHEQFQQDIGRHKGGVELLLAAGFELGSIDDIPVYLSKEPDIETDMDGWSKWFDVLKQTLEILMAAE